MVIKRPAADCGSPSGAPEPLIGKHRAENKLYAHTHKHMLIMHNPSSTQRNRYSDAQTLGQSRGSRRRKSLKDVWEGKFSSFELLQSVD